MDPHPEGFCQSAQMRGDVVLRVVWDDDRAPGESRARQHDVTFEPDLARLCKLRFQAVTICAEPHRQPGLVADAIEAGGAS